MPSKKTSPHKKTAKKSGLIEKQPGAKKKVDKKIKSSHKPFLAGSWQLNTSLFLVFVLTTIVLYAGDLHLGFFRIDDQQYVVKNPWIRSISMENISYILGHPYFVNYSPVHLFSYMLDYAFAGANAFVFHLSSNIWAGIVAGFVYLVGLALTKKRMIAVAAAILFVVHPVHVEAVAWIASRKDLVATAFVLPSFLAYLKYRLGGTEGSRWYVLSLSLFLLAVAGKLSVATFPAVLLAYDLFVEKRSFVRSFIDKMPFLLVAILIAVAVAYAQPKTGAHFDFSVLSKAFTQSMWLLTGFGSYVIYRVAPEPAGVLSGVIGLAVLLIIFLSPLLLRRRFPLVVVLIYWILFTYIPTQVLSFAYPVTDRYLFLPSVAVCILIAWIITEATTWFGKWKFAIAAILLLIITFFWTKKTLGYLNEWRDPRSVWYGAKEKSSDPQVYYNLGWQYMDKAASFGSKRRKEPLPVSDAEQFASVVWKNDSGLPGLMKELSTGQHNGQAENAFQKQLQIIALNYLNEALAKKGKHIMADLYFHRGMLKLDMNDPEGAKKEFLNGIDEASRLGYSEGQQEVLVNCHYNLGIVEWGLGNYQQALKWLSIAEEEQNRFGGTWFPDLSANRKRLEEFIVSQKQH